jgi:hypothetical protein
MMAKKDGKQQQKKEEKSFRRYILKTSSTNDKNEGTLHRNEWVGGRKRQRYAPEAKMRMLTRKVYYVYRGRERGNEIFAPFFLRPKASA